MTDCNREPLLFSSLGRQEIIAGFNGGRLTSDAGGLLLREADRRLGLTPKLAACIPDPRHPLLVIHQQETMLAKRVFGIALGYEDLNDHDTLRTDPLFAVLPNKKPEAEEPLASSPTLCRLENRVARASLARMAEVFVETFIASHQRPPRVIVKAEHLSLGPNTRFVVTNLEGRQPQEVYDGLYTARGDMENRIKEQQLGLLADRTSCHHFLANQFRVLLASAAYVLLDHLRRTVLKGTELARAHVSTIRLKLLKVAARVVTSVRRVVFHLASSYPWQTLFRQIVKRLVPQ